MDIPEREQSRRAWTASLLLSVIALLAQWWLILNPGYYSHDELQWAAYADVRVGPGFFHAVPWLDFSAPQYRPLTFNLWLWLSHFLFEHPRAFHALLVAWGTANAVMLQRLLLRARVALPVATMAALVFVLSPFAVFVQGWVATIGDLVWVSCALLVAMLALRIRRPLVAGAAACAITVIGLLGKESALSIPALLLVAWCFDRRSGRWLAPLAGSASAALLYLGLRAGPLLFAPAHGNLYDWQLAYIPLRWLEYQLFPPSVSAIEAFQTIDGRYSHPAVIASALLWLGACIALWRIHWRWAAAFVVGGAAALGPVLVLGQSSDQYGYGFMAFCCALFALAWPRLRHWGKALLLVQLFLVAGHSLNIMRAMHQVGVVQARFSPALAGVIGDATQAAPLRLKLAPGSEFWLFGRLTHEIPSYRGVAMGERVRIVGADEAADYLVEPDGRLTRVPR